VLLTRSAGAFRIPQAETHVLIEVLADDLGRLLPPVSAATTPGNTAPGVVTRRFRVSRGSLAVASPRRCPVQLHQWPIDLGALFKPVARSQILSRCCQVLQGMQDSG